MTLNSESSQNHGPNLNGLESESLMARFQNTNHQNFPWEWMGYSLFHALRTVVNKKQLWAIYICTVSNFEKTNPILVQSYLAEFSVMKFMLIFSEKSAPFSCTQFFTASLIGKASACHASDPSSTQHGVMFFALMAILRANSIFQIILKCISQI